MGFFSRLFTNLSNREETPYEPIGADNDMLMILKGIDINTIKHDIHDFIKRYNKDAACIKIALHNISPGIYGITFPFIYDFGIFVFFTNFIRVDESVQTVQQITSWCTVKPGWDGIKDEVTEQKAMFYIPANDREYDIVNMVLRSGQAFEIDMGFRAKTMAAGILYHEPDHSLEEVKQYPAEIIS